MKVFIFHKNSFRISKYILLLDRTRVIKWPVSVCFKHCVERSRGRLFNIEKMRRSCSSPQVILGPRQSCSRAPSGTSLAASVAAGVIALTLEAK